MFGLETGILILLILSLLAACAFEFVNGFHDTANAVATVIYTNSLKPWKAVVWAGIWNFIGVFAGGISVAMGIVNLLPVELLVDQNIYHSLAMIGALLLSAIFWNLGTWYLGLPASSSHTLIGSILGVGIAYSFLPGSTGDAVNWEKAKETGLALLFSPAFGFFFAVFLMFIFKWNIKKKEIFNEPSKSTPPPTWIRGILIFTCTAVSFSHGSNDGQKGVGLVMLILIGIIPTYFALDPNLNLKKLSDPLSKIEAISTQINPDELSEADRGKLNDVNNKIIEIKENISQKDSKKRSFTIRKDLIVINKTLTKISEEPLKSLPEKSISVLKSNLKKTASFTDYAPDWVLIMISVSLGLGTMVGWKRIVKTIGEKIGKTHMSYAQGMSAELVASSTIAISTFGLKLPVSTTHVLSSAVAGAMVSENGIKNLQGNTIRNILLAWVLTLPVVMTLSGTLFLIFRNMVE
jgi:low-affinity inorganic phosphate transporter